MRDCIFLLADKNMEATFIGFLTRDGFHLSLGIRQFEFDPAEDLIVDESGSDPGVYTRAHEFLRPYQRTHRYAVIYFRRSKSELYQRFGIVELARILVLYYT